MLCLDVCIVTTTMPQPTEITQFIFGQPLSRNCRKCGRLPRLRPFVARPVGSSPSLLSRSCRQGALLSKAGSEDFRRITRYSEWIEVVSLTKKIIGSLRGSQVGIDGYRHVVAGA